MAATQQQAAIQLQIVTPQGIQFEQEVSELTAPSTEGLFGVLPGHRPLLASLKTGLVSFLHEGQPLSVAVGPGFVEFKADKAVLLTDQFCTKQDIDPVRVRLELKEADEALAAFDGPHSSSEFVDLVARELWAAARLELYGDTPPPVIGTVYEFKGARDILELDGPSGSEPEDSE